MPAARVDISGFHDNCFCISLRKEAIRTGFPARSYKPKENVPPCAPLNVTFNREPSLITDAKTDCPEIPPIETGVGTSLMETLSKNNPVLEAPALKEIRPLESVALVMVKV